MTGRQREGGRGRTHGAPNYKPQEVQVLLDLVEEELPIASKGWRVIGSQFRDWAIVAVMDMVIFRTIFFELLVFFTFTLLTLHSVC